LLGGVAATWPVATRARQGERMRRIGVLMNLAADDPEAPDRIAARCSENLIRIDYGRPPAQRRFLSFLKIVFGLDSASFARFRRCF